jgi:hypothetical protein
MISPLSRLSQVWSRCTLDRTRRVWAYATSWWSEVKRSSLISHHDRVYPLRQARAYAPRLGPLVRRIITYATSSCSYVARIPPVLTVASGAEVSFDCLDASNGQIDPSSTVHSLSELDFSKLDQVNGPVFVESAKPGDVLRVDVLDLTPADWGWTAVITGFGLLADEYLEQSLKIWLLEKDEKGPFAWFDKSKGIRIPLRPFCGEMGVAPGKPGAHSTIPPYRTGGNIDTKHLTKGATLFLPIEAEGALFSIGVCDLASLTMLCLTGGLFRMAMQHREMEVRLVSVRASSQADNVSI